MQTMQATIETQTPRTTHVPVRSVIFDVDGTLIDSNDAHARAWVDVFREFGYDVTYRQLRDMVGMGGDKIIPTITGFAPDDDRAQAISARRSVIYLTNYLPKLRPFPGVRALMIRMRERGLSLHLATSAEERELQPTLSVIGVRDLVGETASGKNAERSKPDPDVIRAVLDQSGIPAAESVFIGDTPYDVMAARRAGVRSIAFRCGGWADTDLVGAAWIWDGTWDMLGHFDRFEREFL